MSGRHIIGAILILLGTGFLLDQLDIWDFSGLLGTWWPTAIILIGVIQLVRRSVPVIAGLIVIGIGVMLQSARLDVLPENLGSLIWPLIIILVGIGILFTTLKGRMRSHDEDAVNHFVAFGGLENRNESQNFRGGSVTALFGGAEIDMRNAQLAVGGASLDLAAAFGGIAIRVPENWKVRVSGLPLFGGWENNTVGSKGDDIDTEPWALDVKCLALFGGIEVKN